MPLAFRKIEHKIFWNQPPTEQEKSWLGEGDLRADALSDIKTDNNCLSIYLLEDGTEVTEERVIGAVGATRDIVAKFDYVVFDVVLLEELHIDTDATPGTTPDRAVNGSHRDLIHLTATKLAALGNSMQRHGTVKRHQHKAVGRIINQNLKAGHIDSGKVPPPLLVSLKDRKYAPN